MEQEILRDIEETFKTLRKINMKLNPKKSTFGAEEGMFLGHVINMKGIKLCPEKAEVVIKLQSPGTLKEVQSLNKKLTNMNRFLSKFAEKSMPFFKTLKNYIKESDFQWTADVEKAFLGNETDRRNQLLPNGKTDTGPGARRKKAKKIFTGTPNSDLGSVIGQEHSSGERPDEDAPPTGIPIEEEILELWTLFTDGSSCLEGFSLPGEIISDNGKQFRDNPFKDWCDKLNIKQKFTSVKHPQTNGLVERANRSVGEGIKARLDQDMLEEKRERAIIRIAKSKARMEKYYNAKVRSTTFKPKDFVYRSNKASHEKERGKLGPKWERPFEVVEALGKGAYKIRNGSGDTLPRTWNVQVLKKCYL
ncbi:reverse transcriptase domain-containing protein [Tanacetum coccineum]